MIHINPIEQSLEQLEQYIKKESYRGYDPYDVLTSPLFRLPFFRSNKFIRLASQQILKHSPINIRTILGIPKGYNPVTLALALQAIAYLIDAYPEQKNEYKKEGDRLVSEIALLSPKGYSGFCWGYDFDWQARYATIPAFSPTVVATGFVTNALFTYFRGTESAEAIKMCISACDFVLRDLNRTTNGETFCFSYSPRDTQVVYNATLKGARLLSQVYSVTKNVKLLSEADRTIRFVINKQQDNGSWAYSFGDSRTWIDNFHTGYVLDCLDEFIFITGKNEYRSNLEKGLKFYLDNFFIDGSIPKYYSNRTYPIDTTAAAQSILTLVRFGQSEKAVGIAQYMISEMQDPKGFFYYQKHKFWTNKISYMRWSNAWMYAALGALLRSIKTSTL